MKKIFIFLFLSMTLNLDGFGQMRRYMSQFNQFQNYFNPAMTGYEGSNLKGFVRNQWAGFDGSPQLFYMSTELDFSEMKGMKDPSLVGKNTTGVTFLNESYGAFVDTEIQAAYAARVRLSRGTNLRLGASINYMHSRLDGNNLTTEQANDPTVAQYLNSFGNMSTIDFNVGLALTHENYYIGYSLQNANRGAINFGEVFVDRKPSVSIFQSGFRHTVSPSVSIASHFMYRSQIDLPNHFEANVKAILLDRIWVGAGHRVNYANNFTFGFVHQQIKFGYTHELPSQKGYLLPYATHEFIVTFAFWRKFGKSNENSLVIW
ncbi:type IX secretion system membrane protein, PorP/SprF family [Belliella buryatensis]|uniref:Type IX secretion system membrane protein, PorP/SprF family n=1 Tax=Belliella buryatensis TaxID=1500549 RepID=A0A239CEN2_9BACT|nr:PorP/SprF family type IX secretion system membrane protein [Belliella buryatensis]SNS17924.1 type IX secretion system membrane protein, PorP/SprF family [Belliella buryatensis]